MDKSTHRWMFACVILIFTCVSASIHSYEAGYYAALVEAETERQYINERMEDVGFCGWVETSDFIKHCQRKDAP